MCAPNATVGPFATYCPFNISTWFALTAGAVGDCPDVVGVGIGLRSCPCPFDTITAIIPSASVVNTIEPLAPTP